MPIRNNRIANASLYKRAAVCQHCVIPPGQARLRVVALRRRILATESGFAIWTRIEKCEIGNAKSKMEIAEWEVVGRGWVWGRSSPRRAIDNPVSFSILHFVFCIPLFRNGHLSSWSRFPHVARVNHQFTTKEQIPDIPASFPSDAGNAIQSCGARPVTRPSILEHLTSGRRNRLCQRWLSLISRARPPASGPPDRWSHHPRRACETGSRRDKRCATWARRVRSPPARRC